MPPIQTLFQVSVFLSALVDLISLAHIHLSKTSKQPDHCIHMAQREPQYHYKIQAWESTYKFTTNKMLLTCAYPNPQYLMISTVATPNTSINLCIFSSFFTTTLAYTTKENKHQETSTPSWPPLQSNNQHSPARLV